MEIPKAVVIKACDIPPASPTASGVPAIANAENIKNGFVTVKTVKGDRQIPIDKEAVKKLLPYYPIIPRERLLELQADPDADKTPEKNLLEAIFNETLDENSKEDQDKVDLLIQQQMKAASRI